VTADEGSTAALFAGTGGSGDEIGAAELSAAVVSAAAVLSGKAWVGAAVFCATVVAGAFGCAVQDPFSYMAAPIAPNPSTTSAAATIFGVTFLSSTGIGGSRQSFSIG